MVKKKRKVKETNQTDESTPASFDSVAVLDEVCNNNETLNETKQPEDELPTTSISELDNTEEDKISVLTYRSKSKSIVSTEHTTEDVDLTEAMNNVITANGQSETSNVSVVEETTGKVEASKQNTFKNICSWINSLIDLIPLPTHMCRICVASTVSVLIVFNIKCFSFSVT